MSDPLLKTFGLLESSSNKHAPTVLIEALDSSNDFIKEAAVQGLLKQGNTRGLVEVIRRLHSLSEESYDILKSMLPKMQSALKQCLLHGDSELCSNSIEIVHQAESFSQIPSLLEMLKGESNEHTNDVLRTFQYLVDRLYEYSEYRQTTSHSKQSHVITTQTKKDVLFALDQACNSFEEYFAKKEISEAILVLGSPSSSVVKKALLQAGDECRNLANEHIMTSTHPGVMQLVCDFMRQSYPNPRVFDAFESRFDPEFITFLLRWLPARLNQDQMKNFSQVQKIPWLMTHDPKLDYLPSELQVKLVGFVMVTGIPTDWKTNFHEWIVKNGTPEARLAAAETMASFDQNAVQNIVYDGLESENEEVQAWATSQLRTRGIPEKWTMLIERLDSPMESVKAAAQEELRSFNLSQMLDAFDQIDPDACRKAGDLIQKIDPGCIAKLEKELENPVRRKRIRAARAALALNMHEKIEKSIIEMLKDKDSHVRRIAVEILGEIDTEDSKRAIKLIQFDPSIRVKNEAAKALAKLEAKNTQSSSPSANTKSDFATQQTS